MSKDVGVDEEMAEVEEEIAMSKLNTQMNDIEGGGVSNTEGATNSSNSNNTPVYAEIGNQIQNLATFVFTPVWIQVFVMTFLGEWGDRSTNCYYCYGCWVRILVCYFWCYYWSRTLYCCCLYWW